jgi:hypothetical protein
MQVTHNHEEQQFRTKYGVYEQQFMNGILFELWQPQPPGTLWDCPGLYWESFTFTLII